jgi:hypothetical protein
METLKTKKMELTTKELELLNEIKDSQHEEGHSEFTNEDVLDKKRAGVLSNLVQKGLVYDSYENYDKYDNPDNTKMWCLEHSAVDIVGLPEEWGKY